MRLSSLSPESVIRQHRVKLREGRVERLLSSLRPEFVTFLQHDACEVEGGESRKIAQLLELCVRDVLAVWELEVGEDRQLLELSKDQIRDATGAISKDKGSEAAGQVLKALEHHRCYIVDLTQVDGLESRQR